MNPLSLVLDSLRGTLFILFCTIGDGWLPFLGPNTSRFYRKKRRVLLGRWHASFGGVPMILLFVSLVWSLSFICS